MPSVDDLTKVGEKDGYEAWFTPELIALVISENEVPEISCFRILPGGTASAERAGTPLVVTNPSRISTSQTPP